MPGVIDRPITAEHAAVLGDRLALRVDVRARALLRAALRRLAGATRPRVERGVWPPSETRCRPGDDLDADDMPNPASLLAAE